MDEAQALDLLRHGDIDVQGRLVQASNATLYCMLTLDGVSHACVYKPTAGERPLWDFPPGTLARREAATYLVSEATGWGLVPPTVLRDGPFGPGSMQWWVDVPDPEPGCHLVDVVAPLEVPSGWLRVMRAHAADGSPVVLVHADDPRLCRMALLDAVTNNADRKGGHVLQTGEGEVFGVDHGLTFNTEDKLRTVLWGWAGDRIPADGLAVLRALREELNGAFGEQLADLLSREEVTATCQRLDALRKRGRFPRPSDGWPAIPWPPF